MQTADTLGQKPSPKKWVMQMSGGEARMVSTDLSVSVTPMNTLEPKVLKLKQEWICDMHYKTMWTYEPVLSVWSGEKPLKGEPPKSLFHPTLKSWWDLNILHIAVMHFDRWKLMIKNTFNNSVIQGMTSWWD